MKPFLTRSCLNPSSCSANPPWQSRSPPRRRGESVLQNLSQLAARDDIAVERRAHLRSPLLRRVVHIDNPKTLRVPIRPLEVVQQTPDEITLHGHTLQNRPV